MFERSKKLEKKIGSEQMAEFAGKFAEKEVNLNIPPQRASAFMILTFLALSGAISTRAEAQVRGVGPQGGRGRQITSEVIGRATSSIGGAIDRQESARKDQVEQEYVTQITQLEDQERQLDQEYSTRNNQIKKDDKQARLELQNWYRTEKNRFAEAKAELRRQYEKTRKSSVKSQILQGVIRGTRGW